MKRFLEAMNKRFPSLKASLTKSAEIKGEKTKNSAVPRTLGSKWIVDCTFCRRTFKTRKVLKTHWKSYHWSDCSTVQRKSKGCPVKGCSFDKGNKALKEHVQDEHDCVKLLDAGIDVYKVRRQNMSTPEKLATLKWLT
jgi:hypothetical protein